MMDVIITKKIVGVRRGIVTLKITELVLLRQSVLLRNKILKFPAYLQAE